MLCVLKRLFCLAFCIHVVVNVHFKLLCEYFDACVISASDPNTFMFQMLQTSIYLFF